MIETTILQYLSNKLTVPCYMERPGTLSESFVVLEKTGSSSENFIKTSTFAIQSFAASMLKAAELNEAVKAAMDASIELDVITRADCNSDYNYTDTTEKIYRYQAVYDITHY